MIKHLKTAILISVPFSVVIFFLREPIVNVLLGRGAFDGTSEKITSGILAGYALAIVGQGIVFISLRFFLSMKYVRYPAAAVIFASVVNIALDALLIRMIGYSGLGFGAAAGGTAGGIIMLLILNRKTNGLVRHNLGYFLRILASCAAMIPAASGIRLIWSGQPGLNGTWIGMIYIGLAFIVLGLIYLTVLRVFGIRFSLKQWLGKRIIVRKE